jgi:RNA polymerase sigma-70 factor (ECF subfamily)
VTRKTVRDETVKRLSGKNEPVEDPDTEIVRRIARGDHAAARILVDRHLDAILALATRMTGNAHEAEDVAQDVFVKVWTHASRWQPGKARFATWMHRVALNLCYDRLRRRRELSVGELPEREDETPGPAANLQADQVAGRVAAALAELPERQRAAITLCHYQGLGNIEAAGVMEISVEALESLLGRGRRALRQKLMAEKDALMGGV